MDGGGFLSQITPVVKWLLILNLGIYFADLFLADAAGDHPLRELGCFSVRSAVLSGHLWEFLTFQFLHGSVEHVLFNCFGIYFFGPWMERWWGSKKFLIFYLLCGAAGAVFYTLLAFCGLFPPGSFDSPLVGASAGIYGILIGVSVIAPDLRVRLLLPPIELSMRQLAIALIAIAAGIVLLGYAGINLFGLVENEGGQAGHLGGAILGFFLVRYPWLLKSGMPIPVAKPKAFSREPLPKLRPRSDLEKSQDTAVDLILDKISREGFQSLTQAEKDFLQKASNAKQSS